MNARQSALPWLIAAARLISKTGCEQHIRKSFEVECFQLELTFYVFSFKFTLSSVGTHLEGTMAAAYMHIVLALTSIASCHFSQMFVPFGQGLEPATSGLPTTQVAHLYLPTLSRLKPALLVGQPLDRAKPAVSLCLQSLCEANLTDRTLLLHILPYKQKSGINLIIFLFALVYFPKCQTFQCMFSLTDVSWWSKITSKIPIQKVVTVIIME